VFYPFKALNVFVVVLYSPGNIFQKKRGLLSIADNVLLLFSNLSKSYSSNSLWGCYCI